MLNAGVVDFIASIIIAERKNISALSVGVMAIGSRIVLLVAFGVSSIQLVPAKKILNIGVMVININILKISRIK